MKRINLTCFVDSLANFKRIPEKEGEVVLLPVETMAHKIHRDSVVRLLGDKKPLVFVMVKLVAVKYKLRTGEENLSWEIDLN